MGGPHAFVIVSGRRRTATVTACDRSFSRNTRVLAIELVRAHRTSSTRLETPILSKTRKRIILDGMLAQIQLVCDFPVAQAICDQMHDRLLTIS